MVHLGIARYQNFRNRDAKSFEIYSAIIKTGNKVNKRGRYDSFFNLKAIKKST